jgi:hypothetical protein
MKIEDIARLRWNVQEDGSGHADVHSLVDGEMVSSSYVFESLDNPGEIPPDLAKVIRNDGRMRGEIS